MDAVALALDRLHFFTPATKAEGRTVQVQLRIQERNIANMYANALDEVIGLTSHDSPVTFVGRNRFTEDPMFSRPAFRVVLWFWNSYDPDEKQFSPPHEEYETFEEYRWYSYRRDEYSNAVRGQLTHHIFIDYSGKEHEQDKFAEKDYNLIVNDPHLMVADPDTVMMDPRRVLTHALNRAIDWVHGCIYNTTCNFALNAKPEPLRAEYSHTLVVNTKRLGEDASKPLQWIHQDTRVAVQHMLQDHPWVDVVPDELLTTVLHKIDQVD